MKPRRAQVRQRDYYEAQTKGTAFCNPKITKAKASKKSFTIYLSVCCPNPFSGRRRPLFSPQKEIFFSLFFLKKNGPNPASFCLFSFFSQHNDNYSTNLTINEIKAQMVCLGFEPGAAGWKAQTDPLSYGGTHQSIFVV